MRKRWALCSCWYFVCSRHFLNKNSKYARQTHHSNEYLIKHVSALRTPHTYTFENEKKHREKVYPPNDTLIYFLHCYFSSYSFRWLLLINGSTNIMSTKRKSSKNSAVCDNVTPHQMPLVCIIFIRSYLSFYHIVWQPFCDWTACVCALGVSVYDFDGEKERVPEWGCRLF